MSTAVFEHAYYIGNYLSGILYGVELVMYFATLRALFWSRPRPRISSSRSTLFLSLYSTALCLLLTLDIACNAAWAENMWITNRDDPGGPPAFIAFHLRVWYQILGSTTAVALIFMGDALLLYRCYILWGSDWRIMVLPVLVYLTAFSLAIVELVIAFTPGGDFFAGRALAFGVTYYTLTIALNVILTVMICARLIKLGRAIKKALAEENARIYTSTAALLAESAAPYALIGIIFLGTYGAQHDTSNAFGQVYAKFACLSPQLIVLRVASGRAWNQDTVATAGGGGHATSLSFHTASQSATRIGGSEKETEGSVKKEGSVNVQEISV